MVAITALAVGGASAVLTLADRVFLHPLPFADSDRLVRMWEAKPGYGQMELSPPNYRDWKEKSTLFQSIAAWRGRASNLTGMRQPVHLEGAAVTANLFDVLGVQPLYGRRFAAEDDQLKSPATMILSESLWREQFGGDPGVLGKAVSLDGQPFVVIGVMPGWLHFPSRIARFWTPMRFEPSDFEDRGNNYLDVVGRLKEGVSLQQARSEMRGIAANLELAYPKENEKTSATVIALRDQVSQRSRAILWGLCGAAVCFLLIACLNLTNLFIARALARRKELSIRTALGAGRERLVRQLVTESLILALAGGTAGLMVAAASMPLLGRLIPQSLPIAVPDMDLRSAALALLLAVGAGLIFGVVPALRACRGDSMEGLREGSRQGAGGRRQRVRSVLVVAEVSLSVALLVGAGLLIRALRNIQSIDPGFRTEGVLTLRTPLPMPKYEQTARRGQFYERVLSEVKALPGVTGASYVSFLPMTMRGGIWPVMLGGRTENRSENHTASLRFVTPGYFGALRIPLLLGRDVSESDRFGTAMAAVVSESFARRYWPGEDPIGRQFKIAFAERRVVGVVRDVRVRGLEQDSEPQVYLPHGQVEDGSLTWYAPKDLVIASEGDTAALMPAIRRIISEADPEQPVTNVQWLSEIVETDTAQRRLQVRLLSAFAGLALLLAAVGLYGLLSYAVAQRTQEFGVRMALGAQGRDVCGLVFRQSLALTGMGLALGAALAGFAARGLEALLYGVRATDGATWGAALGLCLIATLIGALSPAVRAARIDPMEAIRPE